jgi:signal transduction histidine kinase
MPTSGVITIETGLVAESGPAPTLGMGEAAAIPKGRFARITVRDTGRGIPKEMLGRVFEPFVSTKGPDGTGLGLSVVYGGVRQHGGYITVESRPDSGTAFDVFLPLVAT